jgi:SAM-dependent methyltransferase
VTCPRCRIAPSNVVRCARSWLDGVPGRYDVRECPSCRLWITSPRPILSDLPLVYPSGYHRSRLDERRFHPPQEYRGTLLDVGCGVGDSLVQARSEGWRCVGVEISPEAAAVARSRGFDVIVGDATNVDYPEESFDVVRCWHTLEHVPDPLVMLSKLRDAARDDGVIELLLPNRRSLISMLFRRYWYHLDLPRHLHHFRPGDITAMAAIVHLRVRRVRHTASPSGLLGSIDCLIAGASGRPRTALRTKRRARSLTRLATWPIARIGLADVVEYQLVRLQ